MIDFAAAYGHSSPTNNSDGFASSLWTLSELQLLMRWTTRIRLVLSATSPSEIAGGILSQKQDQVPSFLRKRPTRATIAAVGRASRFVPFGHLVSTSRTNV